MAEKSLKELSEEGYYDLTGDGMNVWQAKYSAGDKMWFINTDGVVKKKSNTFTFSVETAIALKGGNSMTVNMFTFRFTTTGGIGIETKTPAVLAASAGVWKIDINNLVARYKLSNNEGKLAEMRTEFVAVADKMSELQSRLSRVSTRAVWLENKVTALDVSQRVE